MNGLGAIIRDHRTALNLSQSQLADLAGLDRTYISMVEREKKCPTIDTLAKISVALGTKPSNLLIEAGL